MAFSNLKHYINALHVYCRLRDLRVPRKAAGIITKVYEKIFHFLIYGRKK